MKATGIIRRIDDLGRIVIPKEIRRQIFGAQCTDGKPMEFFMDGDSIVLRKYDDAEMMKEREIRNKAIDEFAEALKEKAEEMFRQKYVDVRVIDEIAEQLKGVQE